MALSLLAYAEFLCMLKLYTYSHLKKIDTITCLEHVM